MVGGGMSMDSDDLLTVLSHRFQIDLPAGNQPAFECKASTVSDTVATSVREPGTTAAIGPPTCTRMYRSDPSFGLSMQSAQLCCLLRRGSYCERTLL